MMKKMVWEGEPRLVDDDDNKDETPGRSRTTTELNGINKVVESNGSCANNVEDFRSGEIKTPPYTNGDEIATAEKPLVGALSNSTHSPSQGSPPTTKGYGLKKWKRRIRRDFTKDDGGSSVDFDRILKRGLSNTDQSADITLKVASANSPVKSPGVPVVFVSKDSTSSNSRLAIVGSAFPVITDSENSEDRSSRSSTAASVPKLRFDMPQVMGSTRDKNKVKNLIGKSSGAVQRAGQHRKGRIETSKKLKGEKLCKMEKENSYSSVESDLRSSSAGCMQIPSFSGISNGRQGERSLNYDGENSDEAQGSDPQSSEEIRTDYSKENRAEAEDVSQDDVAAEVSWEAKEEGSVNHRPSTGQDPLLESIISLQAVQEALENEIQKFKEIGKEHVSVLGDSIHSLSLHRELASIDPEIHELNLFGLLHSEETERSGLPPLEDQLIELNQKVNLLENKLGEASAILKAKESRIVELEAILNRNEFPKEESWSTVESLEEKCRKFEIELEDLFMQKIEAEIEHLAIARTTQNFKVSVEDQVALFEEQKSLAGEQIQMINNLREAESKAVVLKKQAEELEASCGELLETEEFLKMQNRVCEFTLCFFVQLLLLFVAFWLFFLKLLPHSTGVVPT